MLCSRCHKRPAVVFIASSVDSSQSQGLCLVCAKELGIKPVNDLMEKMGITDEQMEAMESELNELMNLEPGEENEDGDSSFIPGGAATFPFLQNIFSSDQQGSQQNNPGQVKQPETAPKGKRGENRKTKRKHIEAYCTDLTGRAKAGEIDRIIGRDREISRVIQILSRRTKNNPCLIGEPGVGKTAVAEGLALRIAEGSVPARLKKKEIHLLDLTALVAGTQFRGQFESRIKGLVDEVKADGNIILFIDEVHNLVGTGDAEGSMNAANILKPALSRGEIQVIGATTFVEYRKYIEKDAALARRFQRIDVHEPNKAQTLEILSGLRERYENFHHVEISDEALISAVELSSRYVTDRFMPDKAIDLIDEAASMANVTLWKQSVAEETLENEAVSLPGAIIREDEIARVIAQWTGVPVERIGSDDQQDILTLEERLSRRVIGQDEAISAIAKSLRRARAGLSDPTRPLGVFMLLGPSGVGKTELCKALSEALFGSEDALIRVDMSEYSEEATASRLIGSPPGYVGYGDGGQLTDAVLKRPYSVVLFDEIEKAHPKIFSLLLQLLDDGQLTDSVGRKVNFKNTIVMMTSNTGVTFEMDKRLGFVGSKTDAAPALSHRRAIMAQAKQTFRPEFLGRVDEMIVMNSLTQEDGARIAALMLEKVKARMESRGICLRYDPQVAMLLAQNGVNDMSGARNLRRVVAELIEDPLSELILRGKAGREVRLSVEKNKITVTGEQEALAPA